jgi:hypothetical protein
MAKLPALQAASSDTSTYITRDDSGFVCDRACLLCLNDGSKVRQLIARSYVMKIITRNAGQRPKRKSANS